MDDKFLIHIEIAGRRYPLTIRRSDEERARKAAAQINSKMFQYRHELFENDASVDAMDLLAMTAFQLSFRNLRYEEVNETTPFVEKISELKQELEDYLKG